MPSLDRIPNITPERLVTGWAAARGSRVRGMAEGEGEQVRRLWEPLGLDPEALAALDDPDTGRLLPVGLRHGQEALLAELGARAADGDTLRTLAGLSAVLVAQDRTGRIVGALQAAPPGGLLARAVDRGVPPAQALTAVLAVVRIRAVAVAEHARGQGIGAALLHRCLQLYFRLGYHLAYGGFPEGSGLERYYARLGFEVAAPGEGIPLSLPFGISPEPGERLFHRWR
ncbi:GNAT family N-acetyltransferase [Actinomadura kijaniata]|uniref:GNAT family N-acetyltransferase n=1 Tax=Actinomadura kijaniata TaxID=46161 RepID=UPI0008310E11|nr:GNAT family N-acetyltransferase [Actinomadura kijaniata]